MEAVILLGVALCVLPSNVFAAWYAFKGSWRGSAEGTALLLYATGLAVWLDLELVYGLFPLPGEEPAAVGLLLLIGAGSWTMLAVWARSRGRLDRLVRAFRKLRDTVKALRP